MIEKVVSGGQTGVDQAALASAKKKGIPVGGYCPKGGLDEKGVNILDTYPLKEAKSSDPAERTKLNIEESDGTLIIIRSESSLTSINDGTHLTKDHARKKNKPSLVVELDKKEQFFQEILEWICENDIRVLNIGGPRESSCPGIYEETCQFLEVLFDALQHRPCLSKL